MLEFRIVLDTADFESMLDNVSTEKLERTMQAIGNDGVMQVRRNIVTEGKGSGTMAPLSGFNQGGRNAARARIKTRKQQAQVRRAEANAMKDYRRMMRQGLVPDSEVKAFRRNMRAKARAKAEREVMIEQGVVERERKDAGPARDKTLAKKGNRHAGYAAQKQRDFEAGKLEAGADQKLVATGDLERSLYAEVTMAPNLAQVTVRARGKKPSGIANDDLLILLASGTPRMPARNPALNMQQVEARAHTRVAKLFGSVNDKGGGESSG
jgi:hypothetical protein